MQSDDPQGGLISGARSSLDAEANVAAQEAPPGARSWVHEAHADPGRPQRAEGEAPQGPQAPDGLAMRCTDSGSRGLLLVP